MKKRITLALIVLAATVTNAQRNKKIAGNGNVVTIELSTQEYNAITVRGPFDVALVEGKEGNITIKGEDNILEYIETDVTAGTLTIKKEKNLNLRMSRNARVLITIPVESINAIQLSGSGKLSSSKTLKNDDFHIRTSGSRNLELSIETTSLTVRSSGSSNVKLSGSTTSLSLTSSGSSNVNAYDLIADSTDIRGSGSSNIKTTTKESISARASGSSNIRFKGNPEKIQSKTSGSASATKVN